MPSQPPPRLLPTPCSCLALADIYDISVAIWTRTTIFARTECEPWVQSVTTIKKHCREEEDTEEFNEETESGAFGAVTVM